MKKTQRDELKTKTKEEMIKMVRDLRAEIARLSLDMSMGKVENTNLVYQKRKDVARLLTFLSQNKEEKASTE